MVAERSRGVAAVHPDGGAARRGGDPIGAQEYRLGFRTLELVREPLADGAPFAFRVNGRTLVVTGANWIPDDTQLARVTPRRLQERLQAARDAHFTMLRVWACPAAA